MTAVVVRDKGEFALLADLEAVGAISANDLGLHISDPDFPFDTFEALCRMTGQARKILQFVIGDILVIGEQLYGEKAYQAFEALELSEAGMAEYVRVASRVPRSRRRKDLSWSHHRAVAALEPAEQKAALKMAADQGMSHHALRDALRVPNDDSERELCPACGRPL